MFQLITQDPQRVCEWVAGKNEGIWNRSDASAIGLEKDGQLVAGTIYCDFLGQSVCMHTAIEHMNRDFLGYCFYYPFEELQVKKVLGLVDSFNSRAIQLDLHLGFVLESTIKDASTDGDLLIFSMTRDQCRWLTTAKCIGVHYGQQRWRQRPENARL